MPANLPQRNPVTSPATDHIGPEIVHIGSRRPGRRPVRRLTGSEPERGTPAANAPGHPPRTRSPGAPRGNRRVSSGIGGTTSAVRGDRAGTAS
jgi:hypothetical protein